MDTVPKRLSDDDLTRYAEQLDPFADIVLLLLEAGCRYVREHPEIRIEITRIVGADLIRINLEHAARADEAGS